MRKRETPIFALVALLVIFGWVIILSRCYGRERSVHLTWDSTATAQHYEVFLGINRIATTIENSIRARLPYGMCVVSVRAVNEHGASPFSKPLTIPGVHTELDQVIEFSIDLKTWDTRFTPEKRFARIRTTYKR